MKKSIKRRYNAPLIPLFLRYIALILLGIGNLWIIYSIATPLTIYSSKILLGNLFNYIELIPACIAGAAYYLLLILNLSTPMKNNQRVYSLSFSIISFFILNLLRIFVIAYLFLNGYEIAETLHKLSWYLGSTILIILIWFSSVKIFNIKSIPFYTDYKSLKSLFIK